MSKNIQLILNISEIGAGTRGASLGPQAIISAARKSGNTFFDTYKPYILPIFNNYWTLQHLTLSQRELMEW